MAVRGVESKCWILAMFIRDDKERLLLGDGPYEFAEKQQHFAADKITNTVIDVQGNNGVLLAGQTKKATTQSFDGYVGDATMSKETIEAYRKQFINYFQIGRKYTVVYIFPDGSAEKRQRGFLVDTPQVEELWQIHPEYHVSFNFEDVNYYKYNEDEYGNEIYGQSATLLLYNAILGGYTWDETGLVWDSVGAVSQPGVGGTTAVTISSVDYVYPIWTITGLADNPRLQNLTTGQTLTYKGRVAPGQTLEINMLNQTATLNGTNVLQNVSGEWLRFAPGQNRVNYITDNDNAENSTLKWAEVVEA